MLSLTWHLIICLQSESWQAPPSEPSARLCFVVLCQHSPTSAKAPLGTEKTKASCSKGSPCMRHHTMFLLLMPSLPIKSATVNYCNYESELPALPLPPTASSPVCGDAAVAVVLLQWLCCVASVTPWQGIGCGWGLCTHDRGDMREIAQFILDNWASTANGHASSPTH